MKNQKLELIGLQKTLSSVSMTMFFSNGDVKEVFENDFGFKINNKLSKVYVHIKDYKDKHEWDGNDIKVIGKDEKEIKECIIEGNRTAIDNYMYKLGVFSESVEVNRDIIEDGIKSRLESSISMLSSNISMLEHQLSEDK